MNISAGENVHWPANAFRAKKSDLLASMEGVALFRIPADLALPGIPIETVQRLGLALLATQDNRIDSQPDADTSRRMLWLQQELKRQEIDTLNLHKSNTPTNLIELLDVVYQRRILSTKTRIESHTPLSAATATDLFLLLEQKNQLKEQSEENRNINQGLLHCIAAIREINVRAVVDLTHGPNDPRRRLQRLLEYNRLIGREVLIGEDDLNHDATI